MERERQPPSGGSGRSERASVLGAPRQRRLLSVLASASRPVPIEELCRRLVAMERDGHDADAADPTRKSVRIDLHHRCLPGLEAVGCIERQPGGLRLDEPLFDESLPFSPPALQAPDDPIWDVVSALLARPYRGQLLPAVAERDGYHVVEELAAELRGPGGGDERSLRIALHHVDLPKLDAVGALEYDREGRAAAPTERLPAYLDRLELDA